MPNQIQVPAALTFPLTEAQTASLVDDALNAACFAIQEQLGITTGDAAAMYFSGANGDVFRRTMADYIKFEQQHGDLAE